MLYTETEKRQGVLAYYLTGNSKAASKETGIPASTIREWKTKEWWDEYSQVAKTEADAILDSKYSELIHASVDQLKDRIEKGDYVIGKDGKLKRKPVNARDLVIVNGTLFDKMRLLRNQPTSIRAESTTELLIKIAQGFQAIAQGRVIEGEVLLSDGACPAILPTKDSS